MAGEEDQSLESGKIKEKIEAANEFAGQSQAAIERQKELLDTYIGAVVNGPKAARRFNDLIAKTLKLKP